MEPKMQEVAEGNVLVEEDGLEEPEENTEKPPLAHSATEPAG